MLIERIQIVSHCLVNNIPLKRHHLPGASSKWLDQFSEEQQDQFLHENDILKPHALPESYFKVQPNMEHNSSVEVHECVENEWANASKFFWKRSYFQPEIIEKDEPKLTEVVDQDHLQVKPKGDQH